MHYHVYLVSCVFGNILIAERRQLFLNREKKFARRCERGTGVFEVANQDKKVPWR